MPRISQMPPPGPLTGLELTPVLQGGGADGNVGIPILAYGNLPRGAVVALRVPMVADLSSTADADPGAGAVRWDNASPNAATMLYIHSADADGSSIASALAAMTVGGFVYLQASADTDARDTLQKWQITSIASASGYTKVGVTLQSSGGAFVNGAELELTLQQPTPAAGVNRNVVTNVASVAGVLTLDAAVGDYFRATLTENTTLAIINALPGCTLALDVTQGTPARTLAYPSSFRWRSAIPGVITPTAGAVDKIIMSTTNTGATWLADVGLDYRAA